MKHLGTMTAVLALVLLMFASCGTELQPTPGSGSTSSQTSSKTPEPTPPAVTTETPAVSETNPPETSAPTPAAPGESKSGVISSDYGNSIELSLAWTALPKDDGTYTVDIKMELSCYSLFVGARQDGAFIFDGKKYTVLTPPYQYDENTKRSITLGEFSMECAGGRYVPVSAKWHFNGTYGTVLYDWLEVSGDIDLR